MQITGEKQKINCVTLTHNGNRLKYRNIIVRKEVIPIEVEKLNDAESQVMCNEYYRSI